MIKHKPLSLTVSLLPSEIQPELRPIIKSKIIGHTNKYSKQHKIFITKITDITIPKYGTTSRTNFVVSFSISCNVEYIKPEKDEIIDAELQNKNQYGIFLKNEYSKIIVPKSYYNDDAFFELNKKYSVKIIETRYTNEGISCICTFN